MITTTGIANAQTEREFTTFPFVDTVPRTAGVGQAVLVNFGLLNYLAVDGDGWNVTVTITDPNGKTSTLEGMTWSTGTVGKYFVPDTLGTYNLQCNFERVYYNASTASLRGWYAASKSNVVELVVQADPKQDYPGYDVPDSYWTRPIDPQLREWWSISGSWVARPRNAYAPYNDAPDSAHILWTMPIGDTLGGLSGGDTWQIGYQNGDAYEGKFVGAVIIAGVLYYNTGGTYNQATAGNANSGAMGVVNGSVPHQRNTIVAVDLHTGKTLWEKSYNFGTDNDARISQGQILVWDCLNNRGVFAYLWLGNSGNMYAVEPRTGGLVYNMTNVPAGTIYYGPNGEMLKYQLVNYGTTESPNWHLLQWNSSYVVHKGKVSMMESWGSQVQGVTYDAAARGYDLNVSISTPLTGNIMTVFPADRVIVGRANVEDVTLSAISLKSGEVGRLLFTNERWSSPSVWQDLMMGSQTGWMTYSIDDYVAIYWAKEIRVHYAFSLENGKFLWATEPQIYADAWTDSPSSEKLVAYNRLYAASCGGIVYCYDIKDGKLLWTYEAEDKYTESYITENWWLMPVFISDGKIYLGHMEHSALEPKPRGAPFLALDAITGDLVWEIDGAFRQTRWGGRAIIGDSIIVTQDTYDQQIYAIGKGPSSMTVIAPDVAVAVNTPVLIRGTIMDVSPGTDSTELKLRFPNGVPAVSDESMSEWMLYVYKQFPQQMATGVSIRIDAIDPNGNYVTLGDTVSDANGKFSFTFTPDKDGQYNIYAFFDGSDSYYKTDAQTELLVMPAGQSVDNGPPYALYAFIVGIVMIIAIVFIGLLILKKK
ncbi:MAG: PQQ-binding-like beta-propeller repeat protein [Nitrososphaerota archaeon]|jgi:hypothetical protein|nr:PQQ-binding-like beta-propeller repeat protein [Nitrososphaerota archaeon]